MLKRFGFRRKMYYLCTSEEERAWNTGFSPPFFGEKNGVFTSEINFFTLLRNFFLGVCGFFLSNVDSIFADVEALKVKRYLFSKPHFLFEGGKRKKEEGRGRKRGKRRRLLTPHLITMPVRNEKGPSRYDLVHYILGDWMGEGNVVRPWVIFGKRLGRLGCIGHAGGAGCDGRLGRRGLLEFSVVR